MREYQLFTSESVSEGHPDKLADQISDAILDAILEQDIHARVACETLTKTGGVVLAGEISTTANVDFEKIVRDTVLRVGYNSSELGFDGATCAVINMLGKQSPEIAQGVDRSRPEDPFHAWHNQTSNLGRQRRCSSGRQTRGPRLGRCHCFACHSKPSPRNPCNQCRIRCCRNRCV